MQGFLKTCRSEERMAILDELLELSAIKEIARDDYRPMTAYEVCEISNHALFDIGAHTRTHPMLSALNYDEQQDEILGSINAVEQVINKPVDSFAYPFGSNQDINDNTRQIMRSTPITMAVTTNEGLINVDCDRLFLPRIWVGDWDKKTFEERISPCIEGKG
jgi:peptidoglycan/xylan/chitin deacetylase (PgdA/CDA1 family)